MTTQTTYTEGMQAPSPGVISASDFNTITGTCETAAGIGFGLAVSKGASSDKGVVLGGAVAGFRGVTIRDVTLAPSATPDKYKQYDNVGILDRGQIWVEPGEAVNHDDPVYYNSTTGVFYKAAGAGLVGPIPGARWVTSCGIGGRAEVKLGGVSKNGISDT